MDASTQRVFYYHADACPFGGHFTHPVTKAIPSHGSSSLSSAGGHASSRMGPFRVDDLASYEGVYSEIFGGVNETNDAWTTLVTSVVEGLNLLEVVTADRIVSRLSVTYPREEGYSAKVSFVGAQFENLRIAGVPVNPVLNLNLLETPGSRFPSKPFTEDETFICKAIDQSKTMIGAKDSPGWVKARYGWVESEKERGKKGFVPCSLVDHVEGATTGSSYGHVVHVPGFGNVFLGELFVSQGLFRLIMLRTEMGCAGGGNQSAGGGGSNGSPMP
jgi:hypothetical protein